MPSSLPTTTTTASVTDETKTFWLQRQPESTEAPPLLTDNHCPLPSIDHLRSTIAPFAALAQRNTEYLTSCSPQLVQRRDALWSTKRQMDDIEDDVYMRIRDKLFPLARSGAISMDVGNRAAYKLLESMDASGISEKLFGMLQSDTVAGGGNNNNSYYNRNNNQGRGRGRGGGGYNNNNFSAKRAAPTQSHLKQGDSAAADTTGAGGDVAVESKAKRNNNVKPKELVFVDVCGGPGSFAQALLCAVKKPPKMTVRGYGMTLDTRETDDKLVWYPKLVRRRDFTPTFGLDGTGSVYEPANVEAMCSLCVNEARLLLVVGDGGFKVKDETVQEAATAQLVFAQWYMALRLLREGGALVLKLFETSSVFLRSMLTLSCLFFSHVAIVKPAHSRVVNSERYLSCWGFRRASLTAGWLDYLEQVHCTAFATEGAAPFTLLPNVDLDPHSQGQNAALRSILLQLEDSIVTTAERQTAALGMVFGEYNKRRINNNNNNDNSQQQEGEDGAMQQEEQQQGTGGEDYDDEFADAALDDE